MNSKTYLDTLKYGIYGSFICFLLVFSNLLFPFITSKQLIFNILMEVLLVVWVVFIVKFPAYRPKKSYLTYGILAYFAAMLLSCFLGVDFNLSFWGNAERSLGFFHLVHFLIFYLIAITALRTKKDWTTLINVFLVTTILLVLNTPGKGPASTLGNTAYMAGIMIFGVFFALWQLLQSKNIGWRLAYAAVLVLNFIGFWRADISGAQAGMFVGLVTFAALYIFLSDNKRNKIIGGSILGAGILLIVLLFTFRSSALIANSPLGEKLDGFSMNNITLNTRLLSWKSAALDFPSHPLFGVGHGAYSTIFDKHFDPHFYDFTSESYFDRAHNNIVEIASTMGIVGLLAYLSILVAAGYYLILSLKQKKMSVMEFSLVSGLIVAYFVQNLALFDSMVTFVSIFSTLGLVYYFYNHDGVAVDVVEMEKTEISPEREMAWLVVFGLVMMLFIYNLNIKGLMMYSGVIDAYSKFSSGDMANVILTHEAAIKNGTPYNRDSRSILFGFIINNYQGLSKLDKTSRNQIIDYAISLAEANSLYNPKDSLINTQLAQLYSIGARFNYDDAEKFSKYTSFALETIEAAITASPGRLPLYANKADILLMRGQNDEAIATMKTAIAMKENFAPSYCQLADIQFFLKNNSGAFDSAYKCEIYGGAGMLQSQDLIKATINHFATDTSKQAIVSQLESEVTKPVITK
ncbi:MAG: O-antigen ligase family protein [Candidatus Falkowbacteria bacterium]